MPSLFLAGLALFAGSTDFDGNPNNNSRTVVTVACVPGSGSKLALSSQASSLASAGQPYNYQAVATDGRGLPVTYALTQQPSGMTIDPYSGVVNWTPDISLKNRTVQFTVAASNGTCTGTIMQTFSVQVVEAPPGGCKIQIGNVLIAGSGCVQVGSAQAGRSSEANKNAATFMPINPNNLDDGTYKYGDDTKINDFLSFTGDITIVKTGEKVSFDVNGGKVILSNVGDKAFTLLDLGQAHFQFTLDGFGAFSAINFVGNLTKPLKIAGGEVTIPQVQLLITEQGIEIDNCHIGFPKLFGSLEGLSFDIPKLQISKLNGISVTGNITLSKFTIGPYGIQDLNLNFQYNSQHPELSTFTGQGTLVTPVVAIGGNLTVVGGNIQSFAAFANVPAPGLPILPPAIFLLGAKVDVNNIGKPNLSIGVHGDFTLAGPLANLLAVNGVGATFIAPGSLKAGGTLSLLSVGIGDVSIDLQNSEKLKKLSLSNQVRLIGKDFDVFNVKLTVGGGTRVMDPQPFATASQALWTVETAGLHSLAVTRSALW